MATAVLDLDIEKLPVEITGLERYRQARILIRLHGRPVGQTTLPVISGGIGGTELRDALIEAAGSTLWERSLHDLLGWDHLRAKNFSIPTATIAILTRDRPEDVRRCLEALMRLEDDGQEIIVIDNCPATDATRFIVECYPRVRYVREDRPGASAARNRALREARHDIVAFTDDDAAPDPDWLRALLRNFDDPLVLCVTGLTMPLELETEAQEWFERHTPFGRGFKKFVLDGTSCNPLDVARAGTSANMALRRSVRQYVGSFDEALGPGTHARTGEDFDLFSRILTAGYRIVYDPAALSWHRHRRTWKELQSTVYGYGVGVYAYLTRSLFVEGELAAPTIAWGWLWYNQIPALLRSVAHQSDSKPLDLLVAELRGCIAGSWAYLRSRRKLRKAVPSL
jgi:GT2 family glycosyltransferase